MDEAERAERLEAAVRDAVATQAERDREELARVMTPVKRRQGTLVVLLLLTWAAMAWIWTSKPDFAFGPRVKDSPAHREAALRFGMVLEMSRARDFHDQNGRWPASLSDLGGEGEEGVTGVAEGTGFLTRGASGDMHLELNDRMATDSFLGQSLQILKDSP